MRFRNPVRPEAVKAEAGRRIEGRYPMFKQLNIDRAGGPDQAEMARFIAAVIAASHELEAMAPIPPDFAADEYWP